MQVGRAGETHTLPSTRQQARRHGDSSSTFQAILDTATVTANNFPRFLLQQQQQQHPSFIRLE
jgi:hypothetical protein